MKGPACRAVTGHQPTSSSSTDPAALPANAAVVRVYEGSDYASVGNDRVWVEVCDMENDGNGVYGKFQLYGSATWHYVGDGNGSQGGCGNRTFTHRVIVFYVLRTLSVRTPAGAGSSNSEPAWRQRMGRSAFSAWYPLASRRAGLIRMCPQRRERLHYSGSATPPGHARGVDCSRHASVGQRSVSAVAVVAGGHAVGAAELPAEVGGVGEPPACRYRAYRPYGPGVGQVTAALLQPASTD